jgi:hypothetical protein
MIATWILFVSHRPYGQFGMPKPETPLLGAAASGDTAAVKQLLNAGANPNEGRLIGLPAVMFPLMMQNREMFQLFVDANADLQVRDKSGATTLMWAVYNEDADLAVVQQVLKAGVGPQCARFQGGHSAGVGHAAGKHAGYANPGTSRRLARFTDSPSGTKIHSAAPEEQPAVRQDIRVHLVPSSGATLHGDGHRARAWYRVQSTRGGQGYRGVDRDVEERAGVYDLERAPDPEPADQRFL